MILLATASTFAIRKAIATEPAPGSASPDSQPAPTPPRLSSLDPGPLRCECAPVSDSEWHWIKRREIGLAVVGFGVASAAVGLGFAWSAHRMELQSAPRGTPKIATLSQRRQIYDRNVVAGALIGVAGLSVMAAAWPLSYGRRANTSR